MSDFITGVGRDWDGGGEILAFLVLCMLFCMVFIFSLLLSLLFLFIIILLLSTVCHNV